MSKKLPKPSLIKISGEREPLNNAGANRWACQQCALFRNSDNTFKYPFVPPDWTAKLLVVGESPNDSGASQRLLRNLWRKAKYKDNDVAYATTLRCSSNSKLPPKMAQIRACRPFLLQVISKLSPKYLLGTGSTSLRALRNSGDANVTKNRGKLIRIPGV